MFSPTPQKQNQFKLKACKSNELQAFKYLLNQRTFRIFQEIIYFNVLIRFIKSLYFSPKVTL